jgi:hypothetical protein
VAGAALALVTAGCGDPLADRLESSGVQPYAEPTAGPADPGSPETEAFVAEANRLCEEGKEARQARQEDPATAEDAKERLLSLREVMVAEKAGIAGLTPPPGDETVMADVVAAYDPLIWLLTHLMEGGRFYDQTDFDTFEIQVRERGDDLKRALDDYGLESCG